jgi:saccharopine dehydrogenase-like NADP-dependent oxidoreductase
MQKILVFGAGRSASYTITHLLEHAASGGYEVTVADASEANLAAFPAARTVVADVHNEAARRALIAEHQIVISLLPARFHVLVAEDCVLAGAHLITPSYSTPELESLAAEAKKKNLIFINELGLDPGIDHMSAMEIIDRLKSEDAEIYSFKSWCGGLMRKEDLDNPWDYKLSWNPYNVIRAGSDGALYKADGIERYIPYHRLFAETESIEAGGEYFDGYFNRNSLHYIRLYGLEKAETFLRGTLRYPGFCRKWQVLVMLGLTSDKVPVELKEALSWEQYISIFLPAGSENIFEKLETLLHSSLSQGEKDALLWLCADAGIEPVPARTPAESLQRLLEVKWQMNEGDRDRVIMVHEFLYRKDGRRYRLTSWLDLYGEDGQHTAMAKTVGLPLALAAEQIANGGIQGSGMILPTARTVYEPLLRQLRANGIAFRELVEELP